MFLKGYKKRIIIIDHRVYRSPSIRIKVIILITLYCFHLFLHVFYLILSFLLISRYFQLQSRIIWLCLIKLKNLYYYCVLFLFLTLQFLFLSIYLSFFYGDKIPQTTCTDFMLKLRKVILKSRATVAADRVEAIWTNYEVRKVHSFYNRILLIFNMLEEKKVRINLRGQMTKLYINQIFHKGHNL
jgi:hypothetical protein